MATGSSQPLPAHAALQSFNARNAPPQQPEPAPPTAPTKRDLASWWKQFKRNTKKEEDNKGQQKGGIFGVPLNVSIKYANVAISLTNDKGESFIYGYVPIVVAKCGVFLKEQATDVEGIFRLSGSARRIKELQEIFDSPERYGKGLDWSGYTVHDAANILRRYLNQLPEPIVPLDFYERFREPLRNHQAQALGDTAGGKDTGDFDYSKAVATYQQLIRELPPLNKQLLLYILDLLAVFASKSEKNRMTSGNLSAIFQPGLLSHPSHDMAPEEYRLSQDVLIFLIENQDHFLFGMNGTAADPQTVKELQTNAAKSGVRRSASNASAGADSLRKYGALRRNVSVSSKHSRTSSNVQSPGTPTSIVGTGVHRSNTVPSKKSPALNTSKLSRSGESTTPASAGLTPPAPTYRSSRSSSRTPSVHSPYPQGVPDRSEPTVTPGPGQTLEKPHLLGSLPAGMPTTPPIATPTRERKLSSFFAKSPPTSEQKELRQPNRLRKKRIPGSTNDSAQSSTQSLGGGVADPAAGIATSQIPSSVPAASNEGASYPIREGHAIPPPTNDGGGGHHHQPSESTLRPTRSRTPSVHSRSSYTDHSDFDQLDEPSKVDKKENRRSWRFPLKRNNTPPVMSPSQVGVNSGAEFSGSSIGSSTRPRQSSVNESHHAETDISHTTSTQESEFGRSSSNQKDSSQASEPEKRSLLDKFKAKVAQIKEGKDERERAKSPPQSDTDTSSQNVSQVVKDSKDGRRISGEQSRESLDIPLESSSHHHPSTVAPPPVILEEPSSPATVAEMATAPEAQESVAPEPQAETTASAPESKTAEANASWEAKVGDAHTTSETKPEESKAAPDIAAAPVTATEPEAVEKN